MLMQWKLAKIRREAQKKLDERFMPLYKNMSAYIKNSTLSGYETEMVLNEVLDILLEAQCSGKDVLAVNKIIGDDYETFCQSVIDEYNHDKPVTYRIMKYLSRGFLLSMAMMLVFGILNAIIDLSIMPFVDLSDLIFAMTWGFVFLPYALKRFRRMPNMYDRNDMLVLLITIVIVMVFPECFKLIMGHRLPDMRISLFDGLPYMVAGMILMVSFEAMERVYETRTGKYSA